jgi:hypothetical protein
MASLKSGLDRYNLLDVPSYTKMIDTIVKINDRPWIRVALAIMLAVGGRVSEILYLKRGNVKFLDYGGKELPYDKVTLHDTAMIQFNMYTEKNKKTKYRVVPLIKNELFLPLVEIIVEYCKEFQYDDTLLFPYHRSTMWVAVKRTIGKDFYCHYLRHVAVTNDSRAGINTAILQSKFGWTDQRPASVYQHLNVRDMITAQKMAHGDSVKDEVFQEKMDAASNTIIKSMESNIEARKEYNHERGYVMPMVKEEKGPIMDSAKKPASEESELLKKVVNAVVNLPEFKEESKPAPVPVEYPIPVPTREPNAHNFTPVGNLEKRTVPESPVTIKPEGAKFFDTGMIVKDRAVIVTNNKDTLKEMKKVYDPQRYIPLYQPTKAVQTKVEKGIPLTPPNWKINLKNQRKSQEEKDNDMLSVV